MFGVERKMMKLKSTTKNGYAISMMDAVEAPNIFMPEKMRKLASAAKTTEATMSQRMVPREEKMVFIDPPSKNKKGNTSIAVNSELIKRYASGDEPESIFWSKAYTNPHVSAAPTA